MWNSAICMCSQCTVYKLNISNFSVDVKNYNTSKYSNDEKIDVLPRVNVFGRNYRKNVGMWINSRRWISDFSVSIFFLSKDVNTYFRFFWADIFFSLQMMR